MQPGVKRKLRRIVLIALAVVLIAGFTAPLMNANRFRGQIRSALEQALNRQVSIGKVRFNLLTVPGFTVEDVLIQEAPGMGIEPFAHVGSLQARVRLTSLWTGRLAFSRLKLVEPSVNFVKADSGAWNIAALLNRATAARRAEYASFPDIEISDGRLNFKFGDTKSVFYVSAADLEIYPNQNGSLVIRFEGEPARTDHTAQGLGHLVAQGVLHPNRQHGDQLSMSVQLERTALTELMRLFDLQDTGVRGYVASNLKLDGPLSRLNVSGDLRIEDIHRWDLMPNKSEGWTLNYIGFLDTAAQQIDIETRPANSGGSPVNGKFVATNYLSSPQWQASLSFHDLPASGLLETARHMGAPIPPGAAVDATIDGEIGYSRAEGVGGQLVLNPGSFRLPQQTIPTHFDIAPLEIRDNNVRFGPAEIKFGEDETAQLQATYALNTRAVSFYLQTGQASIADTKSLVANWIGTGAVPLLDRCRTGYWNGALHFEKAGDRPGVWTGDLDLANTQLDVPGIAVPLRIASGSLQLQPGLVQLKSMRAHAGTIGFEGDYRYFSDLDRPDRIRLSVAELDVPKLERVLLPTLGRQQSFFARAFGRPRLPEWLKNREIEGTLQVRRLLAGDTSFGAAKARLFWRGGSVQLNSIELGRDDMEGTAQIAVNLAGSVPQYRIAGKFSSVPYQGGSLDLEGKLETRGIGTDVALNARAEGTFAGSGMTLGPDTQVDDVSGEYRLDAGDTGPRLVLSKVQLTQGQDVLHGQGESQADGRIVLDLTSGHKQVKMSALLLPPPHPIAVEP